jgi:hypothetical protein
MVCPLARPKRSLARPLYTADGPPREKHKVESLPYDCTTAAGTIVEVTGVRQGGGIELDYAVQVHDERQVESLALVHVIDDRTTRLA